MRILSLLLTVALVCGCSKKPPEVAVVPDAPEVAAPKTDTLSTALVTLRSGSPERRADAVAKIVAAADDERVLPGLLEALKDPACSAEGVAFSGIPHSSREAAVMASLRIGGEAKSQLLAAGMKLLIDGLKDSKPAVREHTAIAIGLLKSDGKPATDALVALCADTSDIVRTTAYDGLRKVGGIPVEPILKLLIHAEPGVAIDAAGAVRTLKPKGRTAMKLLIVAITEVPSETKNPEAGPVVRNAAALALGGMGAEATDAIDDLVALLKKTTEEDLMRIGRLSDMGAISALRRLGKPTVEKLLPLLEDPESFVRYQAVVVLGLIGPDAADALPNVLKVVETEMKDLDVVTAAALAVVQMGGDATKPAARLTLLLADERPAIQYAVARSIRGLGRAAGEAPVKPLMAILERPETSERVRTQVIGALRALGPLSKPAIPLLAKQLEESEDNEVKVQILQSLGQFGPLSAEAVPALKKALGDTDGDVREAAVKAATAVGPAAKDTLPELLKMLKAPSPNPLSRLPIFAALSAVGGDAPEVVPTLLELLSEPDAEHRRAVVDALGRYGSGSAAVRERLLTMAQKDSQMNNRFAAVRALAGMKNPASAPVFKSILEGKNPEMVPWAQVGSLLLAPDKALVASLDVALRDRTPGKMAVRMQAIEATSLLGAQAAPLLPALGEALKESTPVSAKDKGGDKVRDRALKTISALGPVASPLAMDLDKQMRDGTGDYRRRAIVAAGRMGPKAKDLIPRLREMIRLDPELATDANEAIDRIGN